MPDTPPKSAGGCALLLKALADPTRLAVVRQLMGGPRHVGQINGPLHLDQSLLSHHLRVLRDSGIIEARRDGKAVLYRLAASFKGRPVGDVIDLGCCRLAFAKSSPTRKVKR